MRKLLAFLVVVGLLLVVGDRVAHKFATDEAERRLAAAGVTSPDVDVRGFPFLTQYFARRFDDVRVTSPSVRIGTARAEKVTATGREVDVPRSGPATVGRLTARGTIPYAEIIRQADQQGLRLSAARGGQLQLRRTVTVFGRKYDVVARGRLTSKGTTLSVTPTAVSLAGGSALENGIAGLVANRLTVSYRIRGLPQGVSIDRITPAKSGFVVTASGRNVRLVT
jgi:hypothetical protein